MMGRPIGTRKYKPNEFAGKFEEYIVHCETVPKDRPREIMTKSGFARFAGVHRDTLHEYSKHEGYSDTIKALNDYCIDELEQGALNGELKTAAAIFLLKANYGYCETQNINHGFQSYEDAINELEEAEQALNAQLALEAEKEVNQQALGE